MKKLLTIIIISICINSIYSYEEISLRIHWKKQAQFIGYYVAKYKGYYKKEGLKVNIKEGGYRKNPLKTVKYGLDHFGTKWVADFMKNSDKLISLANIIKHNGLILVSKKNKNIKNLKDLKNKKVSIWYIGNEYQLYILLKEKNIRKYVDIVPQKRNLKQFFNDEVDAVSTMRYNELLEIFDKGYSEKDLNIIDLNNYGYIFPGQTIFTSKKYFKNNRNTVNKFVKASLKGWKYSLDNIYKAVNILLNNNSNNLNKQFQKKQLKVLKKLIKSKKYRLGIHDKRNIKKLIRVLKKYDYVDQNYKYKNHFTNEIIKNINYERE